MNEEKCTFVDLQTRIEQESKSTLDLIVRRGAQQMLQVALELEVAEYVASRRNVVDALGRREVVRNGYLPEREVATGAGRLVVKKPRVDDRREGERFTSKILPPYMRRSPSIDELIPVLYLKGISTGDFGEALEAILGEGASGLSPANIVRLKEGWQQEYEEWSKRDLSTKRYVYLWADGIYFNVRLTDDRPCMLVIMGTTPEGKKELVGLLDGERESKLSWKELLLDLKRRGLRDAPELAVADGALGFWPALEEVFPGTREQRCWVHKTANVLDKLPKRIQPTAKRKIHQMYQSETKREALEAYDDFMALYRDKFPKACECLEKDKPVLFTFYDFPAAHWLHLRTTNPIESTFATVRHRTRQTKGCGSRTATLTMVFKLARSAEKKWRRLHGYQLVIKVLEGVRFVDGIEENEQSIAA
ncbi:MAG TPA: IS256 family transposase [Rhodothermia bacterium]|nr:IS256 family transposase [Rhodothermia bacterium]